MGPVQHSTGMFLTGSEVTHMLQSLPLPQKDKVHTRFLDCMLGYNNYILFCPSVKTNGAIGAERNYECANHQVRTII